MENMVIGIDLGGTNLRIGAVDEENQVWYCSKKSSASLATATDPMMELIRVIDDYIRENNISEIGAISIGVPSSVANDKKTVICTTNIQNDRGEPVFANRNIAAEISGYFHTPVYVNNDTNNILLYDVMSNHLDEASVIVGIYIGTGAGAAVLVNGQLLDGRDGAALDIGHMPYFHGQEACSCGKKGCCECYASGWRLQKIREQYYPETEISDLFVKHAEEPPLKEFIRSCAHIFAIMATIFNPAAMIAGGGVMEMRGFPRAEFEAEVNRVTGKDVMNYGFPYIYSEDTESKGVIGAALFAKRMNQLGK